MVAAYKEQIEGLVEGGADLIQIETQFDLAEVKAAVIAAREVCDLPVSVSMTFEGAQSLTGTPPLTFIDTMQNLGVDLIGTNCSAGPEQIVEIVQGHAAPALHAAFGAAQRRAARAGRGGPHRVPPRDRTTLPASAACSPKWAQSCWAAAAAPRPRT